MVETVDFLKGKYQDPRTKELTIEVTADMIRIAGVAPDRAAARALAEAKLADGSAAERFGMMIAALGGPADFVERAEHYLPKAAVVAPVYPAAEGYVAGMFAKDIGLALIALGGGRKRPDDLIDLSVGFTAFSQVGDRVGANAPLCVIHARNEVEWEDAAARVRAAITVAGVPPPSPGPIVIERIERWP
jgi:thymidine phosphorylase